MNVIRDRVSVIRGQMDQITWGDDASRDQDDVIQDRIDVIRDHVILINYQADLIGNGIGMIPDRVAARNSRDDASLGQYDVIRDQGWCPLIRLIWQEVRLFSPFFVLFVSFVDCRFPSAGYPGREFIRTGENDKCLTPNSSSSFAPVPVGQRGERLKHPSSSRFEDRFYLKP